MSKDDLRNNFTSLISNLPVIDRKRSTSKTVSTQAMTTKRIKRKQSIPLTSKRQVLRGTQSVGPSELKTEVSTLAEGVAPSFNVTTNQSVTKKSASNYPSYFYNPKENLFEQPRASRHNNAQQPKAFHLTQVDSNMAKFIFTSQYKRSGETQSMHAYQSQSPRAALQTGH